MSPLTYTIFMAEDADRIEKSIQAALNDGWVFQGPLIITPWTNQGRQQFFYAQPMTKATEDAHPQERYPMCKDQLAQIDCRVTTCRFNAGAGQCTNVSPAITLNTDKSFVCWSQNANFKEEA
jgi:hypothetical protein